MTVSSFVTNLELRDSNPDGTEGAGLSHTAEGLFLLHVLELAGAGEPNGAITIVHGFGGHGGLYQGPGEFFAERGWAVALPDLRGHGSSEGPRGHVWGMPEPVRDLDSICDHLAYRLPDAPKVVIGTGVGAIFAAAYGLAHPDRMAALVLISPETAAGLPEPPKSSGLKSLFSKPKPTDDGPIGRASNLFTNDAGACTTWETDVLVHDRATRHTAQNLPREAASVASRLSELAVPTLILHGADDPLGDVAASQRLASHRIDVRTIEGRKGDLLREADWTERCQEIDTWLDERVVRES